MENKIKIGQKLYSKSKNGINEHEVTRIGRKYFYIDSSDDRGFELSTLKYICKDYSQRNIQLYISDQEIFDIKESEQLLSSIRKAFSDYALSQTFTLPQLKQIAEIIKL